MNTKRLIRRKQLMEAGLGCDILRIPCAGLWNWGGIKSPHINSERVPAYMARHERFGSLTKISPNLLIYPLTIQ